MRLIRAALSLRAAIKPLHTVAWFRVMASVTRLHGMRQDVQDDEDGERAGFPAPSHQAFS